MLLGEPRPEPDEVELGLRRCNAPLGLLLEGVQDVHRRLEADRVDGPESVAIVARDHFQNARAEALERLGVAVPQSGLSAVDGESHAGAHWLWEALQTCRSGGEGWEYRCRSDGGEVNLPLYLTGQFP